MYDVVQITQHFVQSIIYIYIYIVKCFRKISQNFLFPAENQAIYGENGAAPGENG